MSEPTPNPFDPFFDEIRRIVREEIKAAASNGNGHGAKLLTPEELAEKLALTGKDNKVSTSWVYEQSRQGNIPTHRIGRYLRFDLMEVLESQKKKKETP
jgi:hypothetical protein